MVIFELETMRKTFKHSGARGDLIYSLPTVIALGGGSLYVNRKAIQIQDVELRYFIVDDEEMRSIQEFLRTQPYLSEVEDWDGRSIDFDLDIFREQNVAINLLTVAHLNSFKAEFDLRKPWIEVEKIPVIHRAEIVVSRTSRYHAFRFPWNELMTWANRAVFVGTEEEHQKFQEETGISLPWEMPKSWMELAGMIRGSKLFVGNQSFPYSLAEGMKHPRVLEECQVCPNCHPQSENGHVKFTQGVIRKYLMGEEYQEDPPWSGWGIMGDQMRMGMRRW